jgi:uncharacterized membrane protein
MTLLIVGLLLFLGVHSTRMVADGWRTSAISRVGLRPWKAAYALLSILGFIAIVVGYGQTRADPVHVWSPPLWTAHLAIALTLPAFVLLVAAYVPRNRLRAWVGHPMLAGVKLWALAHLISNGRLGDIVLFGAFLAWAVADFVVSRRRDRARGTGPAPGRLAGDVLTVVIGVALWLLFAHWLHAAWIGVDPMAWMR